MWQIYHIYLFSNSALQKVKEERIFVTTDHMHGVILPSCVFKIDHPKFWGYIGIIIHSMLLRNHNVGQKKPYVSLLRIFNRILFVVIWFCLFCEGVTDRVFLLNAKQFGLFKGAVFKCEKSEHYSKY